MHFGIADSFTHHLGLLSAKSDLDKRFILMTTACAIFLKLLCVECEIGQFSLLCIFLRVVLVLIFFRGVVYSLSELQMFY